MRPQLRMTRALGSDNHGVPSWEKKPMLYIEKMIQCLDFV